MAALAVSQVHFAESQRAKGRYEHALNVLDDRWKMPIEEILKLPVETLMLELKALRIAFGCYFSLAKRSNPSRAIAYFHSAREVLETLYIPIFASDLNISDPTYNYFVEMHRDLLRYLIEVSMLTGDEMRRRSHYASYIDLADVETEDSAQHLIRLEYRLFTNEGNMISSELQLLAVACELIERYERIATMAARSCLWGLAHGNPHVLMMGWRYYNMSVESEPSLSGLFTREVFKFIFERPRRIWLKIAWGFMRVNPSQFDIVL